MTKASSPKKMKYIFMLVTNAMVWLEGLICPSMDLSVGMLSWSEIMAIHPYIWQTSDIQVAQEANVCSSTKACVNSIANTSRVLHRGAIGSPDH
jgi:hypothetical protein